MSLSTHFSARRGALALVTAARFALIAGFAMLGVAAGASAQSAGGAPAIDGIRCDSMESGVFHIHQHITILDHGKPIDIPDAVGRPTGANCLYWIHTHTADGIVHIESPVFKTFTLGDFFDVWGQPLSPTAVAATKLKKGQLHVFVDNHPYSGNPRSIEMTLHADIVIEAGPPYSKPKPFTNWGDN